MVSGTILTIRFIALHMNWIAHHGVRLIGRAAYLKYTQSRIPAVLLFGCRISCTYAPTHFKNGCYLYANTMYGARPGCTHTGDDPTAYPSLPNISSFLFIFWLFLRLIGKKKQIFRCQNPLKIQNGSWRRYSRLFECSFPGQHEYQ